MNTTIFKGTSKQMLELWNGEFEFFVKDHVEKIDSGIQEVWLMKDNDKDKLMGELHILWDSVDKDQANGVDTAYIQAFRINPEYQGKRLGTQLMKRVLERVKENGFTTATIGADDYDDKLAPMYQKWGFSEKIKDSSFDYIYDNIPVTCTYTLLVNKIL